MLGSVGRRRQETPSCGVSITCTLVLALLSSTIRALDVSTPDDFITALSNNEPLIKVTQHMDFSGTTLPSLKTVESMAIWGNCTDPLPQETNFDVPPGSFKPGMCAMYFDEENPFYMTSGRLWLSNLVIFGNYGLMNIAVLTLDTSVYVVDSVVANTNLTAMRAIDSRVRVVNSAFVGNGAVGDRWAVDTAVEFYSYTNPNHDLLLIADSYLPSAFISIGVSYDGFVDDDVVATSQTQDVIFKGNTISATPTKDTCAGMCVQYDPSGQTAPPGLYSDTTYGFRDPSAGNGSYASAPVQGADVVTWDMVQPQDDEAAWLMSLSEAGVAGATNTAFDPLGLAPAPPPAQYPPPSNVLTPPPPKSGGGGGGGSKVGAIVGGIVGGLALLVLCIVGFMYFKRHSQKDAPYKETEAQKPYAAHGATGAPHVNVPPQPEPTTVPDPIPGYAANASYREVQQPYYLAPGSAAPQAASAYYPAGAPGVPVPANPERAPDAASAWLPPVPSPQGSLAAGTPVVAAYPNPPYGAPQAYGAAAAPSPAMSSAGSLPPHAYFDSIGSMPNFAGKPAGSTNTSQNDTLSSLDTKTLQAASLEGGTATSASAPRSRAEQKANEVDVLQQQLDALCRSGAPLASRYKVLPGNSERRVGGQGVVQFCSHVHDAKKTFAVKFFLDRGAFFAEHALYQNNELRGILPPVDDVISNEDGHVNALGRPLPPMVVIEKGEALDEWARRCQPDFPSCVQIIMHLVKRIADLHAKGFTHRDLKPSNCLFLFSNNSWTICDFGCCVPIGQPALLSYTLAYAAPETVQASLRNERQVIADPAVDVWALGVMAYELFTRTRVFPAGSNTTVQKAMTREIPLRWEDEGNPTHAAELRQLGFMKDGIMAMLQRDPAARTSLAEVQRMWKAVLGQETTMVAPRPGY